MKQLELFEGPQPIQKWLHVWTDAERERNKKARSNDCQEILRAESGHGVTRPSGTSGEEQSSPRQAATIRT